ncbi:MAG: hypothetical protein K9W46_14495 [Candidatus Heimdallarchaeum endolithica]|uniref:Uncharacterized protein n=1 Tax=Candidatus Heimdallarchaeum endolithica TaxID=2876572 RepID=A0A9Y1BSI9_9ARCH|nr:MAG: hypothetical protein K9W46_14495 [Candidatus Heimdallarchaeum endolithica]
MRFTKIIIKSQRKIIVVEFIIILSLLFVSSLSFYTFLSSSHTKWSDLIFSSNESDLEVQATQFFETYIDLYNSYYDRFSSYEPVTITIVQSKIIQIEIDNSPVTDYNLLIVNQNLERKFNNINLSTPVLILKDGININLSVVNISWNNELELKNVSLYVAPEKTENVSVFTSFFPTTKEYLFYQNLKKVNLLLTESFFFQTIKKANILSLLRVIANETSSFFSYFKFDKSEYLNYLPAKVKKAYLNYTGEIIKSFLILYNYISNNPASEILAKLKFNDIFLRKYNAFLDFFYQHLFLSISIVFLLSVVFGAITYIYIKQSEGEIRNTILFFNSRGSKSSSQESRMIFIQFMITFISFTISLTTSILLMKSLFQWDISKLVILLDNGVLSFILVILQTRLNSSTFQNIQINNKTYSEAISKSKISEIVIQIFSFIFMILGITLFWINNREFLKAGNLSAVQILLISMSLIIFLGTIIFNFQLFSFISIKI